MFQIIVHHKQSFFFLSFFSCSKLFLQIFQKNVPIRLFLLQVFIIKYIFQLVRYFFFFNFMLRTSNLDIKSIM